nr:hypothetical protein CFP56_03857 [Quercus suber]
MPNKSVFVTSSFSPGHRPNTIQRTQVLQRLVERSRGTAGRQSDTDGQRVPSSSSTAITCSETQDIRIEPGDYDTIEAEVDDLKNQIRKLRESEDGSRALTSTTERGSIFQKHLSATERLQKQHEELDVNAKDLVKPREIFSWLEPTDFPVLGDITSISRLQLGRRPSRGASYATAATIQTTNPTVIRPGNGGESAARAEEAGPGMSSATHSFKAARQDSRCDSMMFRDQVLSKANQQFPAKQDDLDLRTLANQALLSKPLSDRKLMDSPHFARPTVAAARRVDETLRRASISPRSVGEKSPSKSPTARTSREPQRSSKRMALPEAWAQEGALPARDTRNLPRDGGHDLDLLGTDQSSENVMSTPAADLVDSRTHSKIHKKHVSYMLPTKATVRRTMITLGSDNPTSFRLRELALHDLAQTADTTRTDVADIKFLQNLGPGLSTGSTKMGFNNALPMENVRREVSTLDHSSPSEKFVDSRPKTRQAQPRKENGNASSPTRIPRILDSVTCRPRGSTTTAIPRHTSPAMADGLPIVANTTTKRRTSHADILQPILKRLGNEGLRKDVPTCPSQDERSQSAVVNSTRFEALEVLRDASNASTPGVHTETLPPHLCVTGRQNRQSSSGSTATVSTAIGISPSSLMPTQDCLPRSRHTETFSSSLEVTTPELKLPPTVAKDTGVSQTPLLRPTAKEFKPLRKPDTHIQQLNTSPWDGFIGTYLPEEWATMPKDVQKSIQLLRIWKSSGGHTENNAYRYAGSPPKTAQQRFEVDQLSPSQAPHSATTTESHHQVQTGQVLRPLLSSDKAHVQWTMRDINGHEHPVNFGRAAIPMLPPQHDDPHTPVWAHASTRSPHTPPQTGSDDTPATGPKTWSIGVNHTFSPWSPSYAWRGGDGKEIRFSGHAPHAEKNPNDPAIIEFYGRSGTPYRHDQNYQRKQETASRFWPKSKRQWAELAGTSIQPCDDMQILSAIEQIPYVPALGWCNDCTINPFL